MEDPLRQRVEHLQASWEGPPGAPGDATFLHSLEAAQAAAAAAVEAAAHASCSAQKPAAGRAGGTSRDGARSPRRSSRARKSPRARASQRATTTPPSAAPPASAGKSRPSRPDATLSPKADAPRRLELSSVAERRLSTLEGEVVTLRADVAGIREEMH